MTGPTRNQGVGHCKVRLSINLGISSLSNGDSRSFENSPLKRIAMNYIANKCSFIYFSREYILFLKAWCPRSQEQMQYILWKWIKSAHHLYLFLVLNFAPLCLFLRI